MSKTDKYYDVCIKGKRPRINFTNLYKQLNNNIKLVFQGKLEDIFD